MSTQQVVAALTAEHGPLDFLADLPPGVDALLAVPTEEKLEAFEFGARFLVSARGKTARDKLVDELVAAGYPEPSARKEVDLLPFVLSRRYLDALVGNRLALPGGTDLLDGQCVPVAPGVTAPASRSAPCW